MRYVLLFTVLCGCKVVTAPGLDQDVVVPEDSGEVVLPGDTGEECIETWYRDSDADGFGDATSTVESCPQPDGYVADNTDCDDTDPATFPGAQELCDGVDNDCDEEIDEYVSDAVWYLDADGDSYGDPNAFMANGCEEPESQGFALVEDNTDCDDDRADVYPNADELCDELDNDCDGDVDEDAIDMVTWYMDEDGDGYGIEETLEACDQPSGYTDNAEDCDDDNDTIYPDAEESCNGLDDDCDGEVDEDVLLTWYADTDGDGYGDADLTMEGCEAPSGYVSDNTDCDDADLTIYPDAEESCNGLDDDCDSEVDEDVLLTWYEDADADGYGNVDVTTESCEAPSGYVSDATDCDDTTDAAYPGVEEVCDGIDNDCDGVIDESDASDTGTWYFDTDGDGYGNAEVSVVACDMPSGYVDNAEDCDDADVSAYPGATEVCDSVDNDCDGETDEEATDVATWYADADMDGYGDASDSVEACDEPSGYVEDATDCDDTDSTVYPDATEFCDTQDNDCDGDVDEDATSVFYGDADGDSYGDASVVSYECPESVEDGYVGNDTDCDDTNAEINPGMDEACNGIDDDCDGDVDEDVMSVFYADADGDGYGDSVTSETSCEASSGYVSDATDCDDADSSAYPGADEYCDAIDNDCDGSVDESDALDVSTWYTDADGDGYGNTAYTTDACDQPTGYVSDSSDCDDTNASANPGADEVCDSVDNDCDGESDESDATDASTWYADADTDGYGDASTSEVSCEAPSGYVSDSSDCNDSADSAYPGADEYCDAIDNDCDGSTDESDALDASTWYADSDSDSFGDSAASEIACDQPSGYVSDATDCDDSASTTYPGADEYCNEVDDDCDGSTDESDAVDASTWYADADGDSYGNVEVVNVSCEAPSGYVADATDCDDTNASANPGADEVCDSVDNDCDGEADEADATDASTWYADSDGDTYGDTSVSEIACDQPSGYVSDATDCDDTSSGSNPGATEFCDETDNDCDGETDEGVTLTWYADADADGYGDAETGMEACTQPSGYVSDATDCSDADATINPAGEEVCDSVDNDCDGNIDESDATDASTWYVDSDGDTYGDTSVSEIACDQPSGYVSDNTDCDDADASAFPGNVEACDSIDNDCDGTTDEEVTSMFYTDADGDGYGNASYAMEACEAPSGYVTDGTDCDDTNADAFPGNTEVCDSADNDCDGDVDEGVKSVYYYDADADGFGDVETITESCEAPSGYVEDATDCDDANNTIYPGADEYCDGVDEDCDGDVDEDALDADVWYVDNDGDSFGNTSDSLYECSQPSGTVADDTDCDDTDSSTYPGAFEFCNEVDDDCDGSVDEGVTGTWYEDLDEDGFGNAEVEEIGCFQPSGYVVDDSDCDDEDATVTDECWDTGDSGSDTDDTGDTSEEDDTGDTEQSDTSDTGSEEDTSEEDTSGPFDSGSEDTGGDTGSEDTGSEDTGGDDTGTEDTGTEDTGDEPEDTGTEDTGADSDDTGDSDTGDTGAEEDVAELIINIWTEGEIVVEDWFFHAEVITEDDGFDQSTWEWAWNVDDEHPGVQAESISFELDLDAENLVAVRYNVTWCDGAQSSEYDEDHCTWHAYGTSDDEHRFNGTSEVLYLGEELTPELLTFCWETGDTGDSEDCGSSALALVESDTSDTGDTGEADDTGDTATP
jgi:hypothetical protein